MDSLLFAPHSTSARTGALPEWARPRGSASNEADAAFAAGAALAMLDQLVRAEPAWDGVWRQRLALGCAVAAVRLAGRSEEEGALRDALLLQVAGGDPGPAGNIHLAFRRLTTRQAAVNGKAVREIAELLGLRHDDSLSEASVILDDIVQLQTAPPFAAALAVTRICALRPDAETLGWWLADRVLADAMKWQRPVPLLMAQRYGPAFRTNGGRGRIGPGDDAFPRAVANALAQAAAAACRLGAETERRAAHLLSIAPKLRSKGADRIIARLLEEDALLATAPGVPLSRWAASRLFERLAAFDAVRELSGRSSFRVYGL